MENRAEKNFTDAFDRYFDSIYRYCYFRVGQEAAADIAQETFIKTWKYIADGKEIKNIKPFLFRVARNLIIDRSRQKKTEPLDQFKESAASFRLSNMEAEIMDKIAGEDIKKVLEQLDYEHREAVMLRFIEGLKPKEIAKITDETPNVVSVRIHNGLKKLKKLLYDNQF